MRRRSSAARSKRRIDQSGVAAGREYVSKAEALTRFRREFAELAALTTGFDDNPFPASIEVRVRPDADRDGRAGALVRGCCRCRAWPNRATTANGLSRVGSGLETVRSGRASRWRC